MNEINISAEIDITKMQIRASIGQLIKILHEENEIPLNDIVAEMLRFSSDLISEDPLNNQPMSKFDFSHDNPDYHDEDDGYFERNSARDELKNFEQRLNRFERNIENETVDHWDMVTISNEIEDLLNDIDEDIAKEFKDDIKKIRSRAFPLIKLADIQCAKKELCVASGRTIHNINSVSGILNQLDEAKKKLNKYNALTYDEEYSISKTKQRCATHRAKKKMLESEISEQCENYSKAKKQRLEAEAILKQDWRMIFDNDSHPDLEDLDLYSV